jgi:hypothetical protein
MKSHELLKAVIKPYGCKEAAALLVVSLSLIHKWIKARADGRSVEYNPLDRLLKLMQATKDLRPLHWLCAQCGGCFVKQLPKKVWRELTLAKAVAAVIVSAGNYVTLLGQVELADKVSPEMEAKLASAWQELLTEGGSFMGALKQGSFRCGAMFLPLLSWFATGELPELVEV